MKLELEKKWFEKMIPLEGNTEISAGLPSEEQEALHDESEHIGVHPEDELTEAHAFGSLMQLLRRDRSLSVKQLADDASVDVAEIVAIEHDSKYVPKPRTIHQLAGYFSVPARGLLKLSNVTTVHSKDLSEAAIRFAANSSSVMELSREERQALAEFVKFLSSHEVD